MRVAKNAFARVRPATRRLNGIVFFHHLQPSVAKRNRRERAELLLDRHPVQEVRLAGVNALGIADDIHVALRSVADGQDVVGFSHRKPCLTRFT